MSSEQNNDKTPREKLIELVDSINWERPPYRGCMTKLASLRGVSPQAISNAVNIHRNETVMVALLNMVAEKEQEALEVIGRVRGNVDVLLGVCNG